LQIEAKVELFAMIDSRSKQNMHFVLYLHFFKNSLQVEAEAELCALERGGLENRAVFCGPRGSALLSTDAG
jgi:hypothetical protein